MPATLEQIQRRIELADYPNETLLKAFSEQLYKKAGSDFLDEFDSETLIAIAIRALEFIQMSAGEVTVRVYNPSFAVDGWQVPYSVLELGLKDRPFIVDSVRAELRRQGYELYHLLHPIFTVTRDDNGHVVAIEEKNSSDEREVYELYFIEKITNDKELEMLAASVRSVLEDVVLATDAYRAMVEKSLAVSEYLKQLATKNKKTIQVQQREDLEEAAAFMEWLTKDNYVFLGYREYDIKTIDGQVMLQVTPESGLGILSKMTQSAYQKPVPVSDIPEGLRERVTGGRTLIVTKTNAESTVHRPARMDYIGVKKLSDTWQVLGEQRFVGLFTSKALSAAVEDVPILRRKLAQIIDIDKAIPGSHDYKQITAIFNSMPREELFWSDAKQLHKDIRTIMSLEQERGVRLTVRTDPLARGLAAMVIMPRERFNAEVRRKIQTMLMDKLQATHVDYQLAMGEDEAQVRFHFFFTTQMSHFDVDVQSLEHDVAELTRSWEDHLRDKLIERKGEAEGRRLAERYAKALDEAYKADISSTTAVHDIEFLEALDHEKYRVDILNPLDGRWGEGATLLKIYHHGRTLVLSNVLPMLENLGFKVLEQIPFVAWLPEGARGIDIFRVQDHQGQPVDIRGNSERITQALQLLLAGRAENDRLNQLILYGGFSIRQVALLRAYQMYYSQLNAVTSRSFINSTLLHHPKIAKLIYDAFSARFDPEAQNRDTQFQAIKEAFIDSLNDVASLPEDTTLRGLFNLIESTLRTNYFLNKDYISFKLDSSRVSSMPEPRPLFEIGVVSAGVEGVHLRGGKVARGGLRWSDRPDDFRTEVLGLMKTQMTKNAVIVPVGSKGGFVLKDAPTDRDELREYVREQYQVFIRGLLDITDNLVDGEVVHPEGLVIYDGPDPYLVVAADKGTATFSDLANETAAEYDFWLGDAFASGGSHGYDHKAEGITARGAWESVKRHFRELGINVKQDTFTVVGIGDMSGDVFGNGMLYTNKLKLQGAFNHMHIFLDPNPDPEVSYKERERLFKLPRSSWEDYNPELISEGGGVVKRTAKSIPLSPQVKAMLNTDADALSGQDLIKALLRMPVDLLWNGGIGTYVKASNESNDQVGDSSNDLVRVNASELRARVVGEGGNLGFTQLARIEYAQAGGRINTDAIDNSAGVDMSDHEVNIKILLQRLVQAGDLSFVQRNRLLKEMTPDVNALVLKDNYNQSLALSLAQARSREDILLFESLREYLSERGGLNAQVEFLPDAKEIAERHSAGQGFTRPELAILLAYTKMGIYRRLLETELLDEPYFEHYLFNYFPAVLGERYPEAIRTHQLRREITATQFTNTVVDLLGITFVHRSIRDTGATAVEVIRAALIALEILDAREFVQQLMALDERITTDAQYAAFADFVRAVENIVLSMLLNDQKIDDIANYVARYKEPLGQLKRDVKRYLPFSEQERFDATYQQLIAKDFPEDTASTVASLEYLPSGMGVADVMRMTHTSLEEAATRFYEVGERFSLGWLRDRLNDMPSDDKWEKIAVSGLVMDLRNAQRALTVHFLNAQEEDALDLEAYLTVNSRLLARFDTSLREIKERKALNLASAGVLARLLLQMIDNT